MKFWKSKHGQRKSVFMFALIFCCLWCCFASFLSAKDSKQAVQKLIQAFQNYNHTEKAVERIEKILNLEFLGKRAMNLYWAEMSASQQDEFLSLFAKLVRKLAYQKCSNYFKSNKHRFIDQQVIDKRDFLATKSREHLKLHATSLLVQYKSHARVVKETVVFFLYEQENQFIVFDVEALNGSLVKDYRNQFASIIRKKGIDGLLDNFKSRLKQ